MAFRLNPFHTPTVREIAARELEEAERKLMEVERHISYYVALEEHLRREINRLGEYVDEGSVRDKHPLPKPYASGGLVTKTEADSKPYIAGIGKVEHI
jgi:hypothetical protein